MFILQRKFKFFSKKRVQKNYAIFVVIRLKNGQFKTLT